MTLASGSSEAPGVAAGFGVYVHIPFCASKCDYCAFATWTDRPHLIDRYLAAVATEIRVAVDAGEITPASSVFIGGGTPSLVPAEDLAAVIAMIPVTAAAEVTVECNPDDVSESLVEIYMNAGVNRISIGLQSMVPSVLRSLGRRHDPDNVRRAVAAVRRAGLPTFNLDIIYGTAGERREDWIETVQATIEFDPPHISAYGLTVEPGTVLAQHPRLHPDDDDQADKYELAEEMFVEAGLSNYEVSNWARPGHECRHNLLYWEQGDYRGIGCAAHSHRDGRRWWNVRTIERYLERIEAGQVAVADAEVLDAETRRREGLQLVLRTRHGVPASAFGAEDRALLSEAGLVRPVGERLVLTRAGRLLANEISTRLR